MAKKGSTRFGLALGAFAALAGATLCSASAATRSIPAIVDVSLPATPLGTAPPAAIDASRAAETRQVPAGTAIRTPCFSVTTPLPSIVFTHNCYVELSTGTIVDPDEAYFTAKVVAAHVSSAEALTSLYLNGIKSDNLQSGLTDRKPFDRDQGPYIGTHNANIFGLDARLVAWGETVDDPNQTFCDSSKTPPICTHHNTSEYLAILATLPADRYAINGNAQNALVINGYALGYFPNAFAASLATLQLNG